MDYRLISQTKSFPNPSYLNAKFTATEKTVCSVDINAVKNSVREITISH